MRLMTLILCLLCLPPMARAEAVEVDMELFLAVDVSRSMSPAELEIQRRGYAEALTSEVVLAAIRGGPLGRIAIAYVEWAGEFSQRTVVPWTMIQTREDAAQVAAAIRANYEPGLRRTSISGVLIHATGAIAGNDFEGLRRVIDVSGDGPNNQGRPVLRARQAALDAGIVINGLPLMTTDALSEIWGIPDLDVYYRHCVIGGPGAFVIPVLRWDQFAEAVTRKLVLEIAAPRAPIIAPSRSDRAVTVNDAAYDCLIGEKMWELNRSYFDIP